MDRRRDALSTKTGGLRAERRSFSTRTGGLPTIKKVGMIRGLSCAVTAYFMYTVLNLVTAAIAMDRMQDHRAALERNVEGLKEINQRLRAEFDALSTSPELIRLYARELGLYAPGERVIRLQGVGGRPPFYDVGTVEPRPDTAPAPRFAFMLVGVAVGGLLYVRLRFRERSRRDGAEQRTPEARADLLPNVAARRVGDPAR